VVTRYLITMLERFGLDGSVDHLQLEQSKRSIDIEELLFTLLTDVFLKRGGCLWIVTIEATEDFVHMLRPFFASVKSLRHDGGCRTRASTM
jgi:hypothetical protein